MFGTIRRHQKWLVPVTFITVLSFMFFFNNLMSTNNRGGGGGGKANLGSVSGEPVGLQDFRQAQAEVFLHYFLAHGEWPDRDVAAAKQFGFDAQRETYFRLFFISKFKDYNIHVSPDAVGRQAADIFRGMGRNGSPVSPDEFEKQVLTPKGLTLADFRRYLDNQLALQELIALVGMSGRLVTTNEAASLFQLELQEISSEAVFFSVSNFMASVPVNADALGRFYTNNLSRYRLPDRVQVGYVKFNLTNYLTQADAQIAKLTNFSQQVDALYLQRGGTNYYTEAKTPDEAKAKIREEFRRNSALYFARTNATAFAEAVMARTPVQSVNLDTVAAEKGLTAGTSAPFDLQRGPADLNVPATFARSVFKLTPDEPFGGPLPADDGVYVIALKKKLPSEIPSAESVHEQVVDDYKFDQAARLAFAAGTNFAVTAGTGVAQGKTFSAIAADAGYKVVKLPPYSLSTRTLPEIEEHVSLARLQDITMGLPTGQTSGYAQAENGGGVVVHILARNPGDVTKLRTDFPSFLARIRQTRQGEAFNTWFSREAERALRDTPLAHQRQQAQP